MAISDGSENQKQQTTAAQPSTPAAAPQRSFFDGSLFGAPVSRSASSDYLSKIVKNLSESYKNAHPDFEMRVFSIDRQNEASLYFSIVIVAGTMRSVPGLVAVHVMLVEASNEKPRAIQTTVADQQIEILRVSSDAFDERLQKIAMDEMQKQYPGQRQVYVDGCVIPSEFNPEDLNACHSMALNAGTAVGTELMRSAKGFRDLNIATDARGLQTEIEITFGKNTYTDTLGMPMRSDVVINFANRKPAQGDFRQSLNNGDRDLRVSQVSGFVDLLYAPQQQSNNIWGMNQQNMQQKFAPNLIITSLQTEMGYTPAMILLALVTAATANNNNNWVQAFRPTSVRANDKSVDMSDLGAINIEGNLNGAPGTRYGEYQDLRAQNVRPEEINQLISGLVFPNLILSLDVPDCSSQTWYLSIFRDAFLGRVSAQKAIINAANELTNGEFGKIFQPTSPLFENTTGPEGNRVHLGYWSDTAHNVRDIRDFDYLAVANLLGRNNPQYIADWTDTFFATNYPQALRINSRKKFIDEMSNFTAVYKGFATRVTMSGSFMAALVNGCTAAGLIPVVKVPALGLEFARQRGVAGFAQNAMLQGNFGTFGGMGVQSRAGFGPAQFNGRW